jgi:hypothetical protein
MRRNANGARDLFAPVEIGKEVLAESLPCHGWNSVAGQKRGVRGLGIGDRPGGVRPEIVGLAVSGLGTLPLPLFFISVDQHLLHSYKC